MPLIISSVILTFCQLYAAVTVRTALVTIELVDGKKSIYDWYYSELARNLFHNEFCFEAELAYQAPIITSVTLIIMIISFLVSKFFDKNQNANYSKNHSRPTR